ncbi:Fc.00g068450.m01.CDS01 [Cosmosporella sp. VM-42]
MAGVSRNSFPTSRSPDDYRKRLHYARECFEGMKLSRGYDGKLRLFHPRNNCRRMVASAEGIFLLSFDAIELHQLIRKLCAVDGPKLLPKDYPGMSLNICPTLIGTGLSLCIRIPDDALLFITLV